MWSIFLTEYTQNTAKTTDFRAVKLIVNYFKTSLCLFSKFVFLLETEEELNAFEMQWQMSSEEEEEIAMKPKRKV